MKRSEVLGLRDQEREKIKPRGKKSGTRLLERGGVGCVYVVGTLNSYIVHIAWCRSEALLGEARSSFGLASPLLESSTLLFSSVRSALSD